jgi:hypothetical protein
VCELMIGGLRRELERRRTPRPRVDFAFPNVSGDGLRPGVDARHLTDLANELP